MPEGTIATVVLDDVDVTELCIEGQTNHRLNRISTASVRLNMQALAGVFGTQFPGAGSYLKVYYENGILGTSVPTLYHHGRVLDCETTASEDGGYTVFNSSDPFELWQHRPVRDDDGDFTLPELLATYLYAPRFVQAMFNNSIDTTLGGGGPPPTDAEGPLRMTLNSVAGGTVPLGADPRDWPMTMAEFAALLISTGKLDMVCTPIEFDAQDSYGQLDLYEGDYGNDLTGSVIFQYGMGAYNVRALRWNEDMSDLCNKVWYYLGPKCDDQHWQANVTGDDPALAYPPGGKLQPPAALANNPLGIARVISQTQYDVRMDIRIWDALGDGTDCVPGAGAVGYDLYRYLWQNEQWLRNDPRQLVHVTPTRDTEIGSFDIGDLVTVEASSEVKGGFSGGQRVYEYSISWDAEESVPALSELQVSSDQEGFNA
jgi:hypothetical protein